jgi:hypothetical protein
VPVEIAPNNIEIDRLDGGFAPDTPESGLPANASPDMLNLLLERGAVAPETRKGFERLVAGQSSLTGHYVKNLHYYETIAGGQRFRFLIAVMSTGAAGSDNVQLWAYDLSEDTFERIDDAGRAWNQPKSPHWGIVTSGKDPVDGTATYFGGVRGDAIYSWHPITGWDDDPTAQSEDLLEWVDDINDDVDTASEIARDHAFKQGQQVVFEGEAYSHLRDLKFDKWDSDESYKVGDRVTRRHTWASVSGYPKSFECIKGHNAGTNNAPGTGDGWRSFWKKVKSPPIYDDDDEITDAWTPAQNGVQGSVGVWYGDRLMVRRDNENERSLVQYSAPLFTSANQPGKKDKKIADLIWNPRDWAEVDTIEGEGGGHFYVSSGKGDAIRGMYPMGNYLVISKRWSSHVLSGRSEATWSQRRLGEYGVVAAQCMTECDGMVYGLSHNGTLWMTDGTSQREVPGYEKTREYIKERIDRLLQNNDASDEDDENWFPTIWSYDHKVWISLPDELDAGTPDDVTLVYDPAVEQGSWWKLDLPVLAAVVGASNRASRLFFATAKRSGKATLFQYADDPGDLVYTDDDPLGGDTPLTDAIPWHYKTAWLQWGLAHRNRRIRRTWALAKSAVSVTLAGYQNFESSSQWTRTDTVESGQGSTHFEGKTLGHPVSAFALKVSGTAATGGPAIIGYGVDTEPIRRRFRRN